MIKYKGNTSNFLKDLAIGLRTPGNMKLAENTLFSFFACIRKDFTIEKDIQMISLLPSYLKAFYKKDYPVVSEKDIPAVLSILEKYIAPQELADIYSLFPKTVFSGTAKEFLQSKAIKFLK